jgi:hypothetical protein
MVAAAPISIDVAAKWRWSIAGISKIAVAFSVAVAGVTVPVTEVSTARISAASTTE